MSIETNFKWNRKCFFIISKALNISKLLFEGFASIPQSEINLSTLSTLQLQFERWLIGSIFVLFPIWTLSTKSFIAVKTFSCWIRNYVNTGIVEFTIWAPNQQKLDWIGSTDLLQTSELFLVWNKIPSRSR